MSIKGENILLKCRACGTITPADVSHKLSTYIIKNPPTPLQKQTAESKAEKKEARKKALAEAKALEEEDDDDWAVPTTPEAVNQRRLALLGTKDRLSAADGGAEPEPGEEVDGGDGEEEGDEEGDDKDKEDKDEGDDDETQEAAEEKPAAPVEEKKPVGCALSSLLH